jgi:peptidoglycan glycosyltransferase
VNRQIVKLFGLVVALFAVLIGFTSYWSVFDAKALKEKDANARPLLEQQQIKRGRILAADGTVIARSVPKGHGAGLRYVRRYPEGSLYGHPIGYSFVSQGDRKAATSSPTSTRPRRRWHWATSNPLATGPWWRSSRRAAG